MAARQSLLSCPTDFISLFYFLGDICAMYFCLISGYNVKLAPWQLYTILKHYCEYFMGICPSLKTL